MLIHRLSRLLCLLTLPLLPLTATGRSSIADSHIKSLQVVVNQNWLSPAVMRLGTDDVLHVSFDELSHTYHRYICRIERCEADWTPSEDVFESDWLEGFNDNPIEDYENSINTTVPYTHYRLTLPNDRCRLKMSGNYRLHVIDEAESQEVLVAEFMVVEQRMSLSMQVSPNTDIDTHMSHQQVTLHLDYGLTTTPITSPEDQIIVVVRQNGREDNQKYNVRPNIIQPKGLSWTHRRDLIFDAGNEYHKFEILDVSHTTMGLERILWDGEAYQAFPFINVPRLQYLYDEDADGAFYIRNSDNRENDTASDYVWVNYRLQMPPLPEGRIIIDGQWTTDDNPYNYMMSYDEETAAYTATILQKQGYYSYQYLWKKDDGSMTLLPQEGNFYQTENRYEAYVYYRGTGERTWHLTGYCLYSTGV